LKAQVRIFHWDPKKGGEPVFKTYQIPYSPNDKILGSLIYIYKNLDQCLSFRYNCKGRHCGECAITINGKPGLSCAVSMSQNVVLEPLKNLPLVKDLVIRRTKVFQKMIEHLLPIGGTGKKVKELRPIPLEVVDGVIRLDGCIHCLCCMSVCPIYIKEPKIFIGPMGLLTLAANMEFTSDLRAYEKAQLCTECGRCEEVCPRNLPILSEGIMKIKAKKSVKES
jgi:fumarate reductase (CoM/CoB) subunit B